MTVQVVVGEQVRIIDSPIATAHQLASGVLRRNYYAHCTPVESSYQLTKLLIVTNRPPKGGLVSLALKHLAFVLFDGHQDRSSCQLRFNPMSYQVEMRFMNVELRFEVSRIEPVSC